jgi:predicted nucleotidyltransferase
MNLSAGIFARSLTLLAILFLNAIFSVFLKSQENLTPLQNVSYLNSELAYAEEPALFAYVDGFDNAASNLLVNGCLDPTACNFNSAATADDGSCEYAISACETCSGETDGTGTVISVDGGIMFTEAVNSPFDGVRSGSVAFADVDGDGDSDVLITGLTNSFDRVAKLYANDGIGTYTEVLGTPFEGVVFGSVAFSDVDGDTDMDVVITGGNSSNQRIAKMYLNDGNGNYTEVAGTPFEGVQASSIAFSDVDGDSDTDLLITGSNSLGQCIATLYLNDGSGQFTEVIGTPFIGTAFGSIAFSDIDGDGDSDVLITGNSCSAVPHTRLYTNDGMGNYTEVSVAPFENVDNSSISFADIDGDGDSDLLVTGDGLGVIALIYTNDGSGNFTEMLNTPFEGVDFSSVSFGDVDGDGDADVLITGENNSFQPTATLYKNDGSGQYTEVNGTPFTGVKRSSTAFSDIDGDGDLDVLVTGTNSSNVPSTVLYLNESTLPCIDTDGDGIEDSDEIAGCQDAMACNYNTAATDPGVACEFADGACEVCSGQTDGTGTVVLQDADNDGICDGDDIYPTPPGSGGALVFDGANTRVQLPVDVFSTPSSIAVEFWAKSSVLSDDPAVFVIESAYICRIYPDGDVIFTFDGSTIGSDVIQAGVNDGEWHHFFGTNDGTTTSVYIDGVYAGGQVEPLFDINSINNASAIGAQRDGLEPAFNGSIDELRIWIDDIPTEEDIRNFMCQKDLSTHPRIASLAAYYRFDDGTGSSLLQDISGNGINGTLTNMDPATDWVTSGAPIGDQSAQGYGTASVSLSDGTSFTADAFTGSPDGVHVYRVNEAPNDVTIPLAYSSLETSEYYGVYLAGGTSPTYSASLDYSQNTNLNGAANEAGIRVASRADNAAGSFVDVPSQSTDINLNTVTSANQSGTEYILGLALSVGCTDPAACNYDVAASIDSGLCLFPTGPCEVCSGETDGTGTVILQDADTDGVCDGNEIAGCQDATACNYNAAATDPGVACEFADGACEVCSGEADGTGTVVLQDADSDGVCDGDEIAGCQDPTACNYNAAATDGGVTCEFAVGACESCSGETDGTGTIVTLEGTINFTEVNVTPFDGVFLSSIAFADVDGDSDQDVLALGLNGSNQRIAKLYSNNGSGSYTEVIGTPFEGVESGSVAFADVDGDSDQDLLITGFTNSFQIIAKLYTNDGNGNFTEVTGTPFEGVWRSSVAFADVDGDSDQDVLISGRNNSNQPVAKLYTNDGTGNFTEVAGTPFDGVLRSCLAFADVDGDTDQDVLITGRNSSNQPVAKLYTNDGNGNFTEVSGTPFQGVWQSSVAFADVDGDADQDVLIVGGNSNTGQLFATLYLNDGLGSYTQVTGTPFDSAQRCSIDFADVDGDSDQDVLITGENSLGQRIAKLYTNDGSGIYNELTGTPFEGVRQSSVAFADVDGDADKDVLITGENSSGQRIAKLYSNEFTPPCIDTDGDGIEDGDEVVGCQDATACNYNAAATDPGVTCEYADGLCEICSGETDGTGTVILQDADNDGVCDSDEIAGCTDMNACEYDPSATDDDGSCITFPGDTCDDNNIFTADDTLDENCNCLGVLLDSDNDGLSDQDEVNIYNTDPLVQDSDGDGLTDGLEIQFGYDPSLADSNADGCGDALDLANECNTQPVCQGDFNNDGFINSGDLLTFLSLFGTTCLE